MRKGVGRGMTSPMQGGPARQGVLGTAQSVVQQQQPAPSQGGVFGQRMRAGGAPSPKNRPMQAPAQPMQENSMGYADGGLVEARMKAKPGQVTRDYGKKAKK